MSSGSGSIATAVAGSDNARGAAKQRLLFIDAARAIAIGLAILAHGLSVTYAYEQWPTNLSYLVRFITSVATPTFMILFGAMLEMVFVSRVKNNLGLGIRSRLLRRCVQCYFGCLAIIAAACIAGRLGWLEALYATVFLNSANFGNILKFYTVAMVLAIPLVVLRIRIGLILTIGLCLSPWLATTLLHQIPWPDPEEPLGYLTSTLFGQPASRQARYSVLHGLSFVALGMGLGRFILTGRAKGSWTSLRLALGAVIALGALMFVLLACVGKSTDFVVGYITWYRDYQHPYYYAFGAAHVAAMLLPLVILFPSATAPSPMSHALTLFGRRPLLSYTLGNVLVCFWPQTWSPPPSVGVLLTFLLIAMVYLAVFVVDRLSTKPGQTTSALLIPVDNDVRPVAPASR